MTPLYVSIAGSVASILLILVVLELIRSRRLRERYALLWLATGARPARPLGLAGRPGHDRRLARRHRLPTGRALRGRDALHPRGAAALLDGDLEARRPERDPRAEARAARDRFCAATREARATAHSVERQTPQSSPVRDDDAALSRAARGVDGGVPRAQRPLSHPADGGEHRRVPARRRQLPPGPASPTTAPIYYDFMRRLVGEDVDAYAYQFGVVFWNLPFYVLSRLDPARRTTTTGSTTS